MAAMLLLSDKILERSSSWGYLPERIDQQANIIEMRNPPSVLGIGLIESISQASIVALADPEDENGDGISGRPSWLPDGQLGRYGWKANIPTVSDFVADALFNEMGITVHASLSPFTGEDTDSCPDPEVGDDDFTAMSFFLMGLAAPSVDPDAANANTQGMSLFTETGCASCHTPELDGVPLFSDLLLHDVAPDAFVLVEQDPGVSATEYRTPPLCERCTQPPICTMALRPHSRPRFLVTPGRPQPLPSATDSLASSNRQHCLAIFSHCRGQAKHYISFDHAVKSHLHQTISAVEGFCKGWFTWLSIRAAVQRTSDSFSLFLMMLTSNSVGTFSS